MKTLSSLSLAFSPLLNLLWAASCGSPAALTEPAQPRPPEECPRAKGTPQNFDRNALGPDAHRVQEPELCEGGSEYESGGYIRVEGTGTRRFVMGPAEKERACNAYAQIEMGEACPEIGATAFGRAVSEKLDERGISPTGLGMGVCGDPDGGIEGWNVSVSVLDWKEAALAVKTLLSELDRWGAGGHFGVSVRGFACGSAARSE